VCRVASRAGKSIFRVDRDGRQSPQQDGFNVGAQLRPDCTKCCPHNTNSIAIVNQCSPCRRSYTCWSCSQPEKTSWRNTRRVSRQPCPLRSLLLTYWSHVSVIGFLFGFSLASSFAAYRLLDEYKLASVTLQASVEELQQSTDKACGYLYF